LRRLAQAVSPQPKEDILIPAEAFAGSWAYVALVHLHGAQRVTEGCVRYSEASNGLIWASGRSEVSMDVQQNGAWSAAWLPVDATPFYDVIRNARLELPLLGSTRQRTVPWSAAMSI
jgi:hypothetical protein